MPPTPFEGAFFQLHHEIPFDDRRISLVNITFAAVRDKFDYGFVLFNAEGDVLCTEGSEENPHIFDSLRVPVLTAHERLSPDVYKACMFVRSLVLFLVSEQADRPKQGISKRVKTKIAGQKLKTNLWNVPQLAAVGGCSTGNGGNHRSPRLHMVRGHFHKYKCGKGKTKTKINWLKPYWKGKE